MLDVKHFIDLIAAASLAIPAVSRTSLMEHEKFQRQVMKLVEKGYTLGKGCCSWFMGNVY